jgi:hypothetical protein
MKTGNFSPLVLAINAKIERKLTSVSALAELLHCSADSMYRRLRGETDFLHSEAIILSKELNFSLDALYKLPTGLIQFNTRQLIETDENNPVEAVEHYIEKLYKDLSELDKIGIVQIYYAAKDIPLFSFFAEPELVSFKLYFWYMLLFNEKNLKEVYKPNWLPKKVIDKATQLHKMYNSNASTEIWNFETINSTLHQLVYCVGSGAVQKKHAQEILKALQKYILQLEINCTQGNKNNLGKLQLYLNEILLLDNSVIFDLGDTKIFYVPFQTLNFFYTANSTFVESTIAWMHKQQQKSNLITEVGEKDRFRLFKHFQTEIEKCGKQIATMQI